MDVTFDGVGDTAYLGLTDVTATDVNVSQTVVIERGRSRWGFRREGQAEGFIVLDFNRDGVLLGVEVVGARALLPERVLRDARPVEEDGADLPEVTEGARRPAGHLPDPADGVPVEPSP